MDKKNNMKQAMFEMFGVGTDPAKKDIPAKKEESKDKDASVTVKKAPEKAATVVNSKKPAAVSYLAAGTTVEGTLCSDGDVEIAGKFKGDVSAKGKVTLHSVIHGNITANSLRLSGCSLTGDVIVADIVTVSQDSVLCGNVTAKEVQCAGQITGDLKVSENIALESTSQVNGSVITGSMSVAKGAVIRGGIEIKMASACEKTAETVQTKNK